MNKDEWFEGLESVIAEIGPQIEEQRLALINRMLNAGEPEIGLQSFVSYLHEKDIKLSPEQSAKVHKAARALFDEEELKSPDWAV